MSVEGLGQDKRSASSDVGENLAELLAELASNHRAFHPTSGEMLLQELGQEGFPLLSYGELAAYLFGHRQDPDAGLKELLHRLKDDLEKHGLRIERHVYLRLQIADKESE